MKISISNIAWDRSEDEAIAALLQQYGVAGIDVAPGKIGADPIELSAADIEDYVQYWRDHGIQMAGMQSMLYRHPELRIFDGQTARQQTIDYIKRIIDLAAQLGTKPMVFGSPKNRQIGQMPLDEALPIAEAFFTELAQHAHACDTVLCVEPVPPEYGADFLTTIADATAFVKQVNHAGLRLQFDSATLTLSGEDVAATLALARPWMGHFHASDPEFGITGALGVVQHELLAQKLNEHAYDGWVAIEMRPGATGENAARVEAALQYVTSIYGEQGDDS